MIGERLKDPGPAVPVKPEFRIADDVIDAARHWQLHRFLRLDGSEHLVCKECGQSVVRLSVVSPPDVYMVTVAGTETATLAHLMQRHGWTRETHG